MMCNSLIQHNKWKSIMLTKYGKNDLIFSEQQKGIYGITMKLTMWFVTIILKDKVVN